MAEETFSHYKLVRELGRGGMATVYEAQDLVDERVVALKILLPHLSSDEIAHKRFLREAKAGMALDHPGIVKVYEVGEEASRPFIAMELVKGRTLDEIVREDNFDVERVIDIGLKAAEALAGAHERGVIHRDIKPRNIMLTDDGAIKVMDFGLARVVDATALTGRHEVVGTFYYMSPQQAIGAPIDERCDLFSLGVVLYQLLTGALPFEGDHPGAIVHSILHSDPLRMEELREGVPLEVEQVVFKALQKNPQDRYQTAVELQMDLANVREILRGKPLPLIATEEVFEERARGIYSSLVGREWEMGVLEDLFEQMLRGEGSTVLVKGEAGIGKSRLVWELGKRAKKMKARYLVGRSLFGGESFPYQPIFEVLRSYLELKGVKDPDQLGDFIEEKAPHLTVRMGVILAFLLMKEEEKEPSLINREQLWDTANELVKVMAQDRPLVLHLEDLQWADLPTLNLFNYLSRNTRRGRVLIIGTYRPEELVEGPDGRPHPLSAALERMGREELYEEISLARLDTEGTRCVINSVFPHADFTESFADSLYEETEGNPLFILEMLKLLRDEGVIDQKKEGWRLSSDVGKLAIPGRVSDVIMNRLRRLNQVERDIVDVAAVEGRSFQSDTLCHCLRLSRMQVLRALQDLEHSHYLIHASEKEYSFDHSMIREVAYNHLIPELKREYHRLIGEHLTEVFEEKGEYAGKIGHHFLEAGEEKDALAYLVKAGEHAKELFANEEAIEYFDTGIELADKQLDERPSPDLLDIKRTLLENRVEVKELIGRYDDARGDYEDILRIAEERGDLRERARGLNGIGQIYVRKGNNEEALSFYEQALKIQRQIGDTHGESEALHNMGGVYYYRGDYERALSFYEQALKIQRRTGNKSGEGVTLVRVGIIHKIHGDYDVALRCYEEALRIQRQIGDKRSEGYIIHCIGNVHLDRGEHEMALSYYQEALRIQRQIGDMRGGGYTLANIGMSHWSRGDYEKVLSYYEQALWIWRQIGDRYGECRTLINIGAFHESRGDLEKALSYNEEALEISRQIGNKHGEGMTLHNIGSVHTERGDYERVLSYFEQALKIQQQIGDKKNEGFTLIGIGKVHHCRGDYDGALHCFEQSLSIGRHIEDKRGEAYSLNNIGLVHYARGDYEMARNFFEHALSIRRDLGDKQGQCESHHYLFKFWLATGDHKRALERAEEASQLAKTLGIKKMSAQTLIDTGRARFIGSAGEEARGDVQKGLEIARQLKDVEMLLEGLLIAARLEIARENEGEAQGLLEEALDLAADKGRKHDMARSHLLLAHIHRAANDLGEAESHANKAREIAEDCGLKELLWQAHHCLGTVYLRRNRRFMAQEELIKAKQVMDAISSKLGEQLKRTYLAREEVKKLFDTSTGQKATAFQTS